MRNHVHFKFDGTFVWQYVLLIGEVWELVWSEGKALCRRASRENGHWWRGKHYASVGKKDIWSEDGWSR